MLRFHKLFGKKRCKVIGMIHVGALPGTPNYEGSVEKLIRDSCKEAEMYKTTGMEGVLVENMHDIPYVQPKDMGPETTAVLTRVCAEVRRILPSTIPCGIQVLAGGNQEALAVAQSAGLQFIRAEGFVFSHVADEGFTDATAGSLLRYRKNIAAENILIFTDIKKKHSAHAITDDVSTAETAQAAEFFQTDGVIITGSATGVPADSKLLHEVKKVATGPILIGSGVTKSNLHKYLEADAIIVGTHFKRSGEWKNKVDKDRIQTFLEELYQQRSAFQQ